MIYIEAILNGKMCFAARNEGSSDVLHDIDNSIYESWSDLYSKISTIPTITKKQLINNYNIITERYGHTSVVNNFEKLLDRNINGTNQ